MPEWQPTYVTRFIAAHNTSSQTIQVETDVGEVYLKGLSERVAPHILACEWVGTKLASLLGLRVFEHAALTIRPLDDLPLAGGGRVWPGPAFVARKEAGLGWGGDEAALKRVSNVDHIARLVVLDTWTQNCDRYAPHLGRAAHYDNVFLSRKNAPGRRRAIVAMDQGHCFTCGREVTRHLADIGNVQRTGLFGLFPAFRSLIRPEHVSTAAAALSGIAAEHVRAIFNSLPHEWRADASTMESWLEYVLRRADWLAKGLENELGAAVFRQGQLGL